uniref:Uncharacterized protein n=1 Tax=Mycoplasma feriruminatoris TaxID=1179777 RepID=A0A654IQ83_9MOLU|nr:hypothetical protein MF5582_00844 [Mycoplasma feriruminatoris]
MSWCFGDWLESNLTKWLALVASITSIFPDELKSLNAPFVCVPNSILSTTKTTISAWFHSNKSVESLKLVSVFPEPVVCQI